MTEQAATQNGTYYHALVDLAVLAGEIMMASGAETHRTEDTILRILSSTGLPRADAFVLSTGLTLTLSYDPTHTITSRRRDFKKDLLRERLNMSKMKTYTVRGSNMSSAL